MCRSFEESTIATFSILIPNYNYAHYLAATIESALTQQVDLQVLVVDNASTDDSVAIAEAIAARDDRVTIVRHEKNLGLIASLNEGVAWADGDYFVNLSSDDLLTPGSLSRAGELLSAHPEAGFAYGYAVRFSDEAPLPTPRSGSGEWAIRGGQQWLERRCREGHGVLAQPEAVARTKLVQQMGGYDSRLPHTSDLNYFLRLAARADVGFLKGADQVFYRLHGSNMSAGYFQSYLPDLQARWDAFSSLFEKDAGLLRRTEESKRRVAKTLAREALWRVCRAHDQGNLSELPAVELEEFAASIYPDVSTLPEYKLLALRRSQPSFSRLVRVAPVGAVSRRVKHEAWLRRHRRNGE